MPRHLLRLLSLALLAIAASTPLRAQDSPARSAAIRRAAESISASTYRERVAVIAHDSMRGRDTPSPELEKTASWVAAEFRRIGLVPFGDARQFIQRYQLRRSRLDSSTAVTGSAGGVTSTWRLGRDLAWMGGNPPAAPVSLPVVLLSGFPAAGAPAFGDVDVRGAAVVHVVTPEQLGGPGLNQLIGQGIAAGVGAWIVVADLPAPRWAGWLRRGLLAERWELIGETAALDDATPPIMAIRDSAAAGLLAAAGADLASVRAPAGWGVRALAGARVELRAQRVVVDEPTLPNVVGILEGSDRLLRSEAVLFVAHMDHVGVTANGRCAAMGADSVCNGANDNASGTVGLIELAEAYASLRPRPRRTLVFVAVSGEERGLFGSRYYAGHPHPAVPIDRTVAVIGLDEIARNTPDTMIAVGKGFSSLGQRLDEVVRTHPELGLMALDDLWPEQNYFQRSDHYPFARRGVPALVLYGGNSAEVHRPNDVVETADWEKASRIVRVAFYLGLEVANATGRPMWDAAARQRIVQGGN
jgi:hypothetical protein